MSIIRQVKTVLHNFIVLLKSLHSFSFLCNAIIMMLGLYVWQKKTPLLTWVFMTIAILPAGYLLLHVETRFLWPLSFLVMITGILLSLLVLRRLIVTKPIQIAYWCLFFGSFIITPIDNLKAWSGNDKLLFELAAELKNKGVQGKFLSANDVDVQRLAYLTGSTCYQFGRSNYTYDELLTACRQQGIQYFFYYYQTPQELQTFQQTSFYNRALGHIPVKIPNLLLLKMN